MVPNFDMTHDDNLLVSMSVIKVLASVSFQQKHGVFHMLRLIVVCYVLMYIMGCILIM